MAKGEDLGHFCNRSAMDGPRCLTGITEQLELPFTDLGQTEGGIYWGFQESRILLWLRDTSGSCKFLKHSVRAHGSCPMPDG